MLDGREPPVARRGGAGLDDLPDEGRWAALAFVVRADDVLADDAQAEELHAAEEPDGDDEAGEALREPFGSDEVPDQVVDRDEQRSDREREAHDLDDANRQ